MSKGWRGIVFLWLAVQMAGCDSVLDALPSAGGKKGGTSSGTNKLEPPPPVGTLTGVAKDALVEGATVNVYTWDGSKGALLGSGVTDARGRYSLDLQVRSQSVLLEVTGGSYAEEATGKTVQLVGDTLFAVRNYNRGEDLDTAITYYTTLATGLAENLVRLGMNPSDAVQEANARLSGILGIDTISVMPSDIVQPENLAGTELRYGIATAALSSLTERAGALNGTEPHSRFTSIEFIQEAYDDVRADGVLNGRGVDGEVTFGRIRLDAEIYRHEMALHILRIANNKRANNTGLGPMQVLDLAQRLNDSTDPIFGGAPVIPIDRDKPNVTSLVAREFPNLANDSVVFGGLNLSAMVTSFPGAAKAELILDGNRVIGTATDPEIPMVLLDTVRFPIAEGPHTLKLRVTDISQAVGESPLLNVVVSNNQTAIENVSIRDAFVGSNVMVDATITDPAGIASVQYSVRAGNGAFVPIAAPTVQQNGNLFQASGMFNPRPAQGTMFPDGNATFRVEATNSAGFTFLTDVPFVIDIVPPRVGIANPIALDTSNLDDLQGRYFDSIGGTPCMPLQPANPDDRCLLYARRSFNVGAMVSDNRAINSVTFTIDGVAVGQTIAPPGITTNLAPTFTVDPRTFTPPGGAGAQDQPRQLVVAAVDKAQNMAMDRRQVVFDMTNPTAGPISVNVQGDGRLLPATGGRPPQVAGTLNIGGTVTDNVGVAAASLMLTRPTGANDRLDSAENGFGSLDLLRDNLSTRQLADGRYTITLNGTDRAGNVTAPRRRELDVDNTGPRVVADTFTPMMLEQGACFVSGSVADSNGPISLEQSVSIFFLRNGVRGAPDTLFAARNGTPDARVPVQLDQGNRFTAAIFLDGEREVVRTFDIALTLVATDALGNTSTTTTSFIAEINRDPGFRVWCDFMPQ